MEIIRKMWFYLLLAWPCRKTPQLIIYVFQYSLSGITVEHLVLLKWNKRCLYVFFSSKQMWLLWVFCMWWGLLKKNLTLSTFHFTSLHLCHVADCRKLEENSVKGWLWWNALCTVFYEKSSSKFKGVKDTQFYVFA